MSSNSGSSGGIGIFGLLGVAFVVLKLCNVIHWSWWWVTAPFWGGLALILVLVFGGLILTFIGVILLEIVKKAGRRRG